MAKKSEHTVYVRNVSKEAFHSIKRMARNKNQSVNGFMLTAISNLTEKDIEVFNIKKAAK